MNDALVKELDPQLARAAFTEIGNHKSTALDQQLPIAQLIGKVKIKKTSRKYY